MSSDIPNKVGPPATVITMDDPTLRRCAGKSSLDGNVPKVWDSRQHCLSMYSRFVLQRIRPRKLADESAAMPGGAAKRIHRLPRVPARINRRRPRFKKACYGSTLTIASSPTVIGCNLEVHSKKDRQTGPSPSRNLPDPPSRDLPDSSRT